MQTPSPEVIGTVCGLIQRGNRLHRMAEELAAEYGIDIATLKKSAESNGAIPTKTTRKTKPTGSRLEQLRQYLDEHGPQTRKQIEADTKMPTGTVATLLTRNGTRDDDGKWTLKK